MMYGVGKKKALSIIKKSPLLHLGEQTANGMTLTMSATVAAC